MLGSTDLGIILATKQESYVISGTGILPVIRRTPIRGPVCPAPRGTAYAGITAGPEALMPIATSSNHPL
jgi:hypothetical protein